MPVPNSINTSWRVCHACTAAVLGVAASFLAVVPVSAQRPTPGGRPGGQGGGVRRRAGRGEGLHHAAHHQYRRQADRLHGERRHHGARDADNGKPKATVFYIAYTKDGEDAGQAARHLLLQRRSRLRVDLARHGHHEPEAPGHGPPRHPAGAAVRPGRQPELAAGRHGPGAGRRDDDRLLPSRRGRAGVGIHGRTQRHPHVRASSSATTWTSTTAGRHPSTCSARATAPSAPPGWRPSCRTRGHRAQRHHAPGHGSRLPVHRAVAHQRHRRTPCSCRPTRPRRGTTRSSPPTCRAEPRAGRAAVAGLRLRRLHDRAGQGQRAHARRAERRGRAARAAHGRLRAVRR